MGLPSFGAFATETVNAKLLEMEVHGELFMLLCSYQSHMSGGLIVQRLALEMSEQTAFQM